MGVRAGDRERDWAVTKTSVITLQMWDVVEAPIFAAGGADAGSGGRTGGRMRRVILSNITAPVHRGGALERLLREFRASYRGFEAEHTVLVHAGGERRGARQLQEKEKDYPEPNMLEYLAHGFLFGMCGAWR
jgi:hypothetical protein